MKKTKHLHNFFHPLDTVFHIMDRKKPYAFGAVASFFTATAQQDLHP